MAAVRRSRAVIRPAQQGVLVPPVVGQLEAGNQAVFLVEPAISSQVLSLLPSSTSRMRLSSPARPEAIRPRSFSVSRFTVSGSTASSL